MVRRQEKSLETQARLTLHSILSCFHLWEYLDSREVAKRHYLGEGRTNSQSVTFIGSYTVSSKVPKRYPRTLLISLFSFKKGNKGIKLCIKEVIHVTLLLVLRQYFFAGCTGTQFVDQAGLELNPPTLPS